VEPVAPIISVPFLLHWYTGEVPPFTGVAVKATVLPEQDGLFPEVIAMLTEGVTVLITFMVIPTEVAETGLAQLALLVILQVMISPSIKSETV
jgi:hypothetical protein